MAKKITKKEEPKPTPVVHKKKKKKPMKKEPSARELAVDAVYNMALSGGISNSQERAATAQALNVLRVVEMKRESFVEMSINATYHECKEKIFKIMLDSTLKNGLRFIDLSILTSMIAADAQLLTVWEYENLDDADNILESLAPKPKQEIELNIKSSDLFKALGVTNNDEEEDDTSD